MQGQLADSSKPRTVGLNVMTLITRPREQTNVLKHNSDIYIYIYLEVDFFYIIYTHTRRQNSSCRVSVSISA